MVNKASKVLSIPVIAGGGITDGKGLVAALAFGAEGILNATENDTTVLSRSISNPVSFIKNEEAKKSRRN